MNSGQFCLRVAVLFLAGAISAAAEQPHRSDFDAPIPGTYELPVVKPAADGALLEANGIPTTLREMTSGKISLVSFIYTRCGDAKACPYVASVLNHLHRASANDPGLARDLRLVSMSFDPEYDTPERLSDYASIVRDDEGGCEWRFVTPRSVLQTPAILSAYGQAVNRKSNPRDGMGPLNHTLRVYLIDRDRRIRNIYSTGTLDPSLVLADVRTLLMEKTRP